jgi:hypothetical protein
MDHLSKKEQNGYIKLYAEICTFLQQRIEKKIKGSNFIVNISVENLSTKYTYLTFAPKTK